MGHFLGGDTFQYVKKKKKKKNERFLEMLKALLRLLEERFVRHDINKKDEICPKVQFFFLILSF